MISNNSSIHRTMTQKISGNGFEGWEFSCNLCGYQARYLDCGREHKLEIVYIGDPLAYHTNISLNDSTNRGSRRSSPGGADSYVGDAELPAEVVKQLEEILNQFDWDEF